MRNRSITNRPIGGATDGRTQKWQGNGEESDKFCWRCERTPVGATLRTKELKAVKTAWPEEY